MKLEDQVSNLELSKRLKELGIEQETSLFYWSENYDLKSPRLYSHLGDSVKISVKYSPCCYAAFTVAELGEILPSVIDENKLTITKHKDGSFSVAYHDGLADKTVLHECEKTEADARAKMLIWLIENGKMKV